MQPARSAACQCQWQWPVGGWVGWGRAREVLVAVCAPGVLSYRAYFCVGPPEGDPARSRRKSKWQRKPGFFSRSEPDARRGTDRAMP